MKTILHHSSLLISLCTCILLSSCFTGVESTPRISDKDVENAIIELDRRQPPMSLEIFRDSVPAWQFGKKFYVTDNNIRHIFVKTIETDCDTTNLNGQLLEYTGYASTIGIDNRKTIDIKFKDDNGHQYTYRTGKEMSEFTSAYSIPLLVDMDMVKNMSKQLKDKEVYIKTPIWYDDNSEHMITGKQYIKVKIIDVCPGNKILPFKIIFRTKETDQKAFVWMASALQHMTNRDYDSLFSSKDIHENYPSISNECWKLIINGEVCEEMTKDECRLAKGAPKSINRMPDQAVIREYWYYDAGAYLYFVDGLLKKYRN
ncbi:MAG: hypothetical protein KBT10_06850 [Bacteroidales bacterium]|nr:hypothetical protein [Candidatus Sodaliphilus aphodohippi]